ncbi:MAG: hypothetical protein P8J32_04370 [bacterium]|nr:hypothetical protein [bacterium]
MTPKYSYTIRTAKNKRHTMMLAIMLMALGLIASFGRLVEESVLSVESIVGTAIPGILFVMIPIMMLASSRKAWNVIQIYDNRFVMQSLVGEIGFQKSLLTSVRTNRVERKGAMYGIVQIVSPIKDFTLKFDLLRDQGPEAFAWFQEIEVEQTGEPNPDKLEGPAVEITHEGFSKRLHVWRNIQGYVSITLLASILLMVAIMASQEGDLSLFKEFWLELSVVITLLSVSILGKRKHTSNPVVKVEINERALLLSMRTGEIRRISIQDIRKIELVGEVDAGVEPVYKFSITSNQGSWNILVRKDRSGGKELKAWLDAAEGEHTT